jgi:signal transduction histidine kinase
LHDVLENAVRNSSSREPVPILEMGAEDIFVNADSERLTVVIEHLVRNAQEATGRDGSVRVIANAPNGAAMVTISDTGCGMSPEFVSERLFRPFDSTKGSQSMGIGAYQAREYIGMLGGKLEVESVVEQGTTFSLRLPVATRS